MASDRYIITGYAAITANTQLSLTVYLDAYDSVTDRSVTAQLICEDWNDGNKRIFELQTVAYSLQIPNNDDGYGALKLNLKSYME